MSAMCLCGVCVPYIAIIPLLLVVLQYIARPLYQMGLTIPDVLLAKKLGITTTTIVNNASSTTISNDACNSSTNDNKCCDSDAASVLLGVAGRIESSTVSLLLLVMLVMLVMLVIMMLVLLITPMGLLTTTNQP